MSSCYLLFELHPLILNSDEMENPCIKKSLTKVLVVTLSDHQKSLEIMEPPTLKKQSDMQFHNISVLKLQINLVTANLTITKSSSEPLYYDHACDRTLPFKDLAAS